MKGKVISIRLSYSELQNCVDVSELVMGRKTSLTHAIQTTLRVFIARLEEEGKLYQYDDDTAKALLEDSFGKLPGKTLSFDANLEYFDRKYLEPGDFSPAAAGTVDAAGQGDAGEAGEDFPLTGASAPQAEKAEEIEKAIEEVKKEEEKDFLKRIIKE